MAESAAPAGWGRDGVVRIFLCGDVMIGRGIDQILPHPCPPRLHEAYAHSALDYVALAEGRSGPIPRATPPAYIWGCALEEFERWRPDARLINLETSITLSEQAAPKGINYRVSPRNAECLRAARIDACALANNHVLDYGPDGLMDTLQNLSALGIACAGAGSDEASAKRPAMLRVTGGNRVIMSALALTSSGAPLSWAATRRMCGLVVREDEAPDILPLLAEAFTTRAAGDVAIASIHWGGNWGYDVERRHVDIARGCVDELGVSIVHGHSSHHPKPFAFHRKRLILYGCGDFLNDYEGISNYAEFRAELVLMYFADVETSTGEVLRLSMIPLRVSGFRLTRPSQEEKAWILERLAHICEPFGTRIKLDASGAFISEPHQ